MMEARTPLPPYDGPPPQLGGGVEPDRAGRRARIGLWLGPAAAIATYLFVPVGPFGI